MNSKSSFFQSFIISFFLLCLPSGTVRAQYIHPLIENIICAADTLGSEQTQLFNDRYGIKLQTQVWGNKNLADIIRQNLNLLASSARDTYKYESHSAEGDTVNYAIYVSSGGHNFPYRNLGVGLQGSRQSASGGTEVVNWIYYIDKRQSEANNGRHTMVYTHFLDTIRRDLIYLDGEEYYAAIRPVLEGSEAIILPVHFSFDETDTILSFNEEKPFISDLWGLHCVVYDKAVADTMIQRLNQATLDYISSHPEHSFYMNLEHYNLPSSSIIFQIDRPAYVFGGCYDNTLSFNFYKTRGVYHFLLLDSRGKNVLPRGWETMREYDRGKATYYTEKELTRPSQFLPTTLAGMRPRPLPQLHKYDVIAGQTMPLQPLVQILKTSNPQELTNLNPQELTNSRTQNLDIPMVRVDGGIFMMGGCASKEFNTLEQNLFTHEESVRSFMISPVEVTQELWTAVMGNEVAGVRAKYPVDRVSWNDCQTFIARLNAMTGRHYRLPTEREWEFAARGGIYSHGYRYAGSNFTDSVAWVAGYKTGGTLHPVATKCPNELGLYDMSGNVYEWCQDLMHAWKTEYDPINRYEGETEGESDAQPSPNGDYHIMRGGSCYIIPREANHVAMRVYSRADGHMAGLRLAHDVEDSDSGVYAVMVKRGQTFVFTRVSPTEVALMSAIDRASLRGKLSVPQTVTIGGTQYTVVAIAASALQGCNNLTAIHLPATLRYIGPMAFNDCPKLGRITVDSHNPVYTESMFKRSPEGNFLFKLY